MRARIYGYGLIRQKREGDGGERRFSPNLAKPTFLTPVQNIMHAHSFNFRSSFTVKGSGIKCKGPCSEIILETLKDWRSKKHKFHIYSAGKI